MSGALRMLAVTPPLVALTWCAALAVQGGVGGARVYTATSVLNGWPSFDVTSKVDPRELRDIVAGAQATDPTNPAANELLGLLPGTSSRAEYASEAAVHFRRSIELRPTSPYAWASLAATDYQLGNTGEEFRTALVRATEMGPYEPGVQRTVADFGLAVWDDVDPSIRNAIEENVARGMRTQPRETLQIAQRRGRLAVACHHAVGTPRQTDAKWLQPCQSTEATS
jgi:hypothetical protein